MSAIVGECHPVARVQHRCTLCHWPIEPGTKHRRYAYVDEDGWSSHREHTACTARARDTCESGDDWSIEGDDEYQELLLALTLLDDLRASPPPMTFVFQPFRQCDLESQWWRFRAIVVRATTGVVWTVSILREGATVAQWYRGSGVCNVRSALAARWMVELLAVLGAAVPA